MSISQHIYLLTSPLFHQSTHSPAHLIKKGPGTITAFKTCTPAGSAAARHWNHRAFTPALP
ncbi:repeat set, removed [Histoplasma ohiense]|nr:repeat set, removed [Histoplasma ohiense (nom. inval.)]